jgi:hypothetical protein
MNIASKEMWFRTVLYETFSFASKFIFLKKKALRVTGCGGP